MLTVKVGAAFSNTSPLPAMLTVTVSGVSTTVVLTVPSLRVSFSNCSSPVTLVMLVTIGPVT